MPHIQFNCPDEIDAELKHYMIDKGFEDKREAVIEILKKYLKV